MNIKTSLRRSPSAVAAVCLSCTLLFCLLNIIIRRENTEDLSQCSDAIEYLLGEYKALVLQKTTLHKQKYLEVKELKSNLKKTAVNLKLKEEECSSDISHLNESVHMWQEKGREMQRLLDGAFATMDRSSVVLTTVLQALQKAELRVEELERKLAGDGSRVSSRQEGTRTLTERLKG